MTKFEELLKKFQNLPKVKATPPTFLEIAGYPHYENVCSNILAFFFDTTEQHQYGELFIRSLLAASENNFDDDLSTINVYRERITYSGNRLDLLIETENLIIAIENKIWAPLYNNLKDYSDFLQKEYPGKRIFKIVLSLHKIGDNQLSNDFRSVTHYELLEYVKKGMGEHLLTGNNKYLFQLVDFIETMQKHTKTNTMNKKVLDFFKEEKEKIDELLDEHREIQRFIHNKVKSVQNILNQRVEEEQIELLNNRQWIWQKFDLVHDFDLGNGLVISVDSYFEIDGIGIKVWVRKGTGNKMGILNNLNLSSWDPQIVDDQFWIQEKSQMEILTPDEKVAEKILQVLNQIRNKTHSNEEVTNL